MTVAAGLAGFLFLVFTAWSALQHASFQLDLATTNPVRARAARNSSVEARLLVDEITDKFANTFRDRSVIQSQDFISNSVNKVIDAFTNRRSRRLSQEIEMEMAILGKHNNGANPMSTSTITTDLKRALSLLHARGQTDSTSHLNLGKATALHIETPLIHSEPLSRHLRADVYLKMDCLQPPGSFKIRGVGATVQQAVENGSECVVCSSGGNAGLAAAYAGHRLGIPVTVVLPSTTPLDVHDRLQAYGANVIVYGDVWDEADQHARQLVKKMNGAYVHPFDQPSTWQGHATIVQELERQLPRAPDAIVTCVGGGGLLMGILKGLEASGSWGASTRVVACETEGAASMAGSLAAGELITLPAITSVAKSLGAKRVSADIFKRCQELGPDLVHPFVMSDAAAVAACIRLSKDHRVLVEPACGAALAAVTEKSAALAGCDLVVVEVCGGAIVDIPSLSTWANELGVASTVANS